LLLKDKILQNNLEKDGYVVIPFLKPAELEELNSFYSEIHNGAEPPLFIDNIHMTTWCKDSTYKQSISENLSAIFANPSDAFFENYRRLNNVFIVKRTGQQTTFKVHQDWNVVDETKYQSVNVWVPLHEVDENSGALWVLKGSHNIDRKVRGAGYLFPDYGAYYKDIEKKITSVKLKAGEAIVFFHSIIHGSPPNLSGQHRKAACFSVIPKNAPLCIYFQPGKNDPLKQFAPDDDFIYKYDSLRTESLVKPPAEIPVNIMPSFSNKEVELDELSPYFQKKKLFSFLRS
jgi:hypothetical protein